MTTAPTKIETLRTRDGLELHMVQWQPTAEPKAVILIVHGIGEHTRRYDHVADAFVQRGYAVYGYDHRGHGKSGGERAHFTSFDLPVEDMRQVFQEVRQRHPGKKLFIYAHSMGSLISTLYVLKYPDNVAGFVSSGSPLGLEQSQPAMVVKVGGWLSRVVPRARILPMDLSVLSRDPKVVETYANDPLNDNRPTSLGMAREILASAAQAYEKLPTLNIPLLLVHGDADKLCPPSGSQMIYDRAGSSDKQLKWYPGLRHEIHNELEQAEVIADILNWIDARV
jgi:alpha-beta hydrolase superfamily lysophospholipase